MNIDDLLELDNQEACYKSFYKGFNVWQANRFSIIQSLIGEREGLTYAKNIAPKKFFKLLKYVVLSFLCRPKGNKTEVLFLSYCGEIKDKSGKYEQRFCGKLYDLISDKSVIIEKARGITFFLPTKYPSLYRDWIIIKAAIIVRLIHIFYRRDKKNIKKICHSIEKEVTDMNSNVSLNTLSSFTFKQYLYFTVLKRFYLKMLKKMQPKIIFMDELCYGVEQAFISACRELGIITAELQHGYVAKNHPAYNYGTIYFTCDKLITLLPDYFLTMGKFWSDSIRIPSKIVEIGAPYLQSFEKKQSEKIILILSYTDKPEVFCCLAKLLVPYAEENGYKILLKLHFSEFNEIEERYGELRNISIIEILTSNNVYELLQISEIVISSVTTVAYEALHFGIKPYVIYDEFTKDRMNFSLFESFKDVSELISKLKCRTHNDGYTTDYVWEPDYKKKFKKFLQELNILI